MNAILLALSMALSAQTPIEKVADRAQPCDTPASPSDIQALHARLSTRVTAIRLRESVVELRKALPNDDGALRADMVEAFTANHAAMLNALSGSSLTDAQRARLDAEFNQRLASVEATVTASRLNRALALERTETINFGDARMRCDTRDLRNIEKLAQENNFTPLEVLSLDKSASRITTSMGAITLYAGAGNLAEVVPWPTFSADEQVYKLGLLPGWVFSTGLELTLGELVPTVPDELQLVGRRDGQIVVQATLRRDIGYRMTELRIYTNSGQLRQECTMSDYRPVGDVFIPFRTVNKFHLENVPDRYVERREVKNASVNVPIAPDMFEIPPGWRIQRIENADVK